MLYFSPFWSLTVCDDYIINTEWKNACEDSLKIDFFLQHVGLEHHEDE